MKINKEKQRDMLDIFTIIVLVFGLSYFLGHVLIAIIVNLLNN
jgi:hypothetical protein